MKYESIRLSFEGDVAILTLDRPERLNSVTPAMFDEISHALANLGGARALLIAGAGRGFCAGADLAARAGHTEGTPGARAFRSLTEHYNPVTLKLADLPLPIVSAVNGPAAGIGCALALSADFVVVGQKGYFLQAFVNIGLVPDGGASLTLQRLIGKGRATRMIMLGERVYGPQAVEWGLAYQCVADDEVHETALALARRLAGGPTLAIGLMRGNIARASDGDFAATLAREAEAQRIAGDSADAAEGGRAFLEKRKASFTGR